VARMADSTPSPRYSPRKRLTSASSPLRLAQLVRTPTISPARMRVPAHEGEVVVEVGSARITISPGADVTTVVTILALLGGRS